MIDTSVTIVSAVFLSCLVAVATISDVLQTYDWQEHIADDYPKYWFAYEIKFVEERLKSLMKTDVVQILHGMNEKLHIFCLMKYHKYQIEYGSIGWEVLYVTDPLLTKKIEIGSFPSDLSLGMVKESTKSWIFSITGKASMLIQCPVFRVYGHYYLCSSDFIIDEDPELFAADMRHTLCGLLSGIIIHTLYTHVRCAVRVKPTDVFSVLAVFDMKSPDLIFSNLHLNFSSGHIWGSMFVFKTSVCVTSVHVMVTKSYRVILFLLTRSHTEIYDGPGALSPRVLPTGDSVTCSTFQCILLIELQTNETVDKTNQTAYRYTEAAISASVIKSVIIEADAIEHNVKSYSSPKKQAPLHSLDIFLTSSSCHVTVVLKAEYFRGMEHPACLYGGVALIDSNEDKVEEIANFCWKNNNNFNFEKIMYSNRNTMLLVTYMYNQYLKFLDISFRISATCCEVLKFDVCESLSKNRNEIILYDLLLSGKITIGEFHEGQTKGGVDLKISADVCTMVQLFVKHNFYCSFPHLLHKYFHKIKMVVTGEQSLSAYLQYNLTGVFSSMGHIGFTLMNPEQESHLKVGGTAFNFDNNSTSHFVALNTESQVVLNLSLFDWLVNEHSGTYHVIRIQPHYKSSIFYNFAFSSTNLAHPGSLFFELAMWGAYSWIHVDVTPKKGHSQDMLLICQTPKRLPVIVQDSSLLLTVTRMSNNHADLQLIVNVTLMVNE